MRAAEAFSAGLAFLPIGWHSFALVKDVIFFLVLVAILVIRPTGLLGREGYR